MVSLVKSLNDPRPITFGGLSGICALSQIHFIFLATLELWSLPAYWEIRNQVGPAFGGRQKQVFSPQVVRKKRHHKTYGGTIFKNSDPLSVHLWDSWMQLNFWLRGTTRMLLVLIGKAKVEIGCWVCEWRWSPNSPFCLVPPWLCECFVFFKLLFDGSVFCGLPIDLLQLCKPGTRSERKSDCSVHPAPYPHFSPAAVSLTSSLLQYPLSICRAQNFLTPSFLQLTMVPPPSCWF